MSMQTRCPRCQTQFHIRREQIEAAGGMVRCGECLEIFDARPALIGDPPEPSPAAPAPVTPDPAGSDVGRGEREQADDPAGPVPECAPLPARSPVSARGGQTPGEAPRRQGWTTTLAWGLANLLLLATLLGQYLLVNREVLADRPEFRPLIAALCRMAGCEVAPRRDPSAFELTGRTVQSHPDFEGSLLIDAAFVNGARFAQPYPSIEILFTDTENRVVASRRFPPGDYLPAPASGEMAPGGEARLLLEILDPGEGSVGYEIRFF